MGRQNQIVSLSELFDQPNGRAGDAYQENVYVYVYFLCVHVYENALSYSHLFQCGYDHDDCHHDYAYEYGPSSYGNDDVHVKLYL